MNIYEYEYLTSISTEKQRFKRVKQDSSLKTALEEGHCNARKRQRRQQDASVGCVMQTLVHKPYEEQYPIVSYPIG